MLVGAVWYYVSTTEPTEVYLYKAPDKQPDADATINPIGRLNGRPFCQLVEISNKLTAILYDRSLSRERRAEILSTMLKADYREMYEGAVLADESREQHCDGPCFAAIQDTIIRSYTDETLDVFWYYERQGQDSVLMFDMQAYNRYLNENESNEEIIRLNAEIELNNESAERVFSPDNKYAVYVTAALDPYAREQILAGREVSDGLFIYGITLIDIVENNTPRILVEPGSGVANDYIRNIIWNLDSDAIFFSSGDAFASSWNVYRCDIENGHVGILSDGNLVEMLTDEPYECYLKVLKSCFVEGKEGRHWYYSAISPDGNTEVRLTEPSLDI